MGTCKSCRHWQPEDRSPTGMVCNKISGSASVAYPLLIINSTEKSALDRPLRMATSKQFGCTLYEGAATVQ